MSARAMIAVAAAVVAASVLGCSRVSAPPPDKMAEAELELRRAHSTSPETANTSPDIRPDMEISQREAEAMSRVGVSVPAFRAGLRKMEEDGDYKTEADRRYVDLAFPVPDGGPRRRTYQVATTPRYRQPNGPTLGMNSREQPYSLRPVVHIMPFSGPCTWRKAFDGTGFGVVFEDDGDTGYLYATDEGFSQVLDALCLYNADDADRLHPGEKFRLVWNPSLLKVGMYYHDRFQAVVDFRGRKACCRLGFPQQTLGSSWPATSHVWVEELAGDLSPS